MSHQQQDALREAVQKAAERLHIDNPQRSAILIELGKLADPDALLSTVELAAWLGVSKPSIEKWRWAGVGPRYIRVSPTVIRYRRADVLAWLEQRSRTRTNEPAPKARPARTRLTAGGVQ